MNVKYITYRYFRNTSTLFIYFPSTKTPIIVNGESSRELWVLLENNSKSNSEYDIVTNYIKMKRKKCHINKSKNKPAKNVWKMIREQYAIANQPMSCFLEVTAKCNYACTHCYLSGYTRVAKNELSLQEIMGIIDWLKSENTYKITISGGEPFARDDIFDILKYAVESGMTTHIFSNVSLLSKDMITELSKMGIARIEASVYAYSRKTYKAITGSSTRDKVYDNLEYLADTGIEIVAKTPLLHINRRELGQMATIFAKLGIPHLVDPLQIRSGHFEELSTDTFCDISLLEESLDNIHYEWSVSNDRSDLSKQVCGGGSRNIMIDATGGVYPCASLRIGDYNIREMKIEKIWGDGLLRKHHQLKENHLKKCIGCKNKDICPYCPGRAYITTGDMKIPDKYFCDTISLLKKYSIGEQHE